MDALGATVLVVALAWALARWAVPALRRRGLDRARAGVETEPLASRFEEAARGFDLRT